MSAPDRYGALERTGAPLKDDGDLQDVEAWLNAVESMIALLAAQLPAAARTRFAAALRELEATGPELNARLSWSAALQRVRLLIGDEDEKSARSDEPGSRQ